jgi:hypothetical protein
MSLLFFLFVLPNLSVKRDIEPFWRDEMTQELTYCHSNSTLVNKRQNAQFCVIY